jgi:glycosyltransferase involved in cell wall biosynthesis
VRLAFLTHEPFYPPTGGGSAEAVYLVREFVQRGHAVHLFCPSFANAGEVAGEFGVEVHPFKAWAMGRYTAWRNLKYLAYPLALERLVARAARQIRFDAFFAQHAIAAVAAGRLKRRWARPAVMNFLDYLTGFLETWPRHRAPRALIGALERFERSLPVRYGADAVLTVSDTLADHFARAGYPRAKLRAIYYGYDAALFRPLPAAGAARQGPPVVVMHGSFDQHHLGPIALDAVCRVGQSRPEVRFRFVGRETAALQRFRRQVRARAPSLHLEGTGFVPYEEVARHLGAATVGIVPYEESTGTHCAFVAKIVEYLGLGMPVVSTPLDGVRRYFRDEPCVRFAGFDGSSFAERMLECLGEAPDQRWRVGQAASQRVRAALDWGVIRRRAVDFVEQLPSAPTPD